MDAVLEPEQIEALRAFSEPPSGLEFPPATMMNQTGVWPSQTLGTAEPQLVWAAGKKALRELTDLGLFTPNIDIADIGCGAGRIAYALYDVLKGTYIGLDVIEPNIRWLSEHFPRGDTFHFRWLNVFSRNYNVGGLGFTGFPIEAGTIDLCLLYSVFSHMRWNEIMLYMHEMQRILRARGKVHLTMFRTDSPSRITDDEARAVYLRSDIESLIADSGFCILQSSGGDDEAVYEHGQWVLTLGKRP